MRRNLVCAALGLALAVVYWLGADALPTSLLADAVGAAGVPKGVAAALALFSIAAVFSRAPDAEHRNPLKALGIAAIGFAYVAVVPFLGYVLSIAAVAGGAALYYGAPRRWGVLAFALGTALGLWVLFAWLLCIPMP